MQNHEKTSAEFNTIPQPSLPPEATLLHFADRLLQSPATLADDTLFDSLLDLLVANPDSALVNRVSERLSAWSFPDFLQYFASRLLAPPRCQRHAGHSTLFQIYLSVMEQQFPRLPSGTEEAERLKAEAEKTTLLWMEAWLLSRRQFHYLVDAPEEKTPSVQSLFFTQASLLGRRILFYYGKFLGVVNMLVTTFFAMVNLFVHIPMIGLLPVFYPIALALSGIIAIASAVIFWKYEVPFLKKTLGLQTRKEAPPVFIDHRLQVKYTKVINSRLEKLDAHAANTEPLASLNRVATLFHQDVMKKDGPGLLLRYHEEKARKEKYVRVIDRISIVIGLLMSGATSFFGWTAMSSVITQAIAGTVIGGLLGPAVITAITLTLTALAVTTAMGVYLTKQVNRLNPEEKAVNVTIRKINTYRQILESADLKSFRHENERLNQKNQSQFYHLMQQESRGKQPDIPKRFEARVTVLREFRQKADSLRKTGSMVSLLHPRPFPGAPLPPPTPDLGQAADNFRTYVWETLLPIARSNPASLMMAFPPERIAALISETEKIRLAVKSARKHDEVILQEAKAKLHQVALLHLKAYLERREETALKARLEFPAAPLRQSFAQTYLRWLPRAIHVYLNIGGTANGLVSNYIGSNNLIHKIAALTTPAVTHTSSFTLITSMVASFFAWLNVRFYHQFELEFLKKSLGIKSRNDIIRLYKATRTQIKLARLINTSLEALPPDAVLDPEFKNLKRLDQAFGQNLKEEKAIFVGKSYSEKKWTRAFNRFATLIGAFNPAGTTFFSITAMLVGSAALVGFLHVLVWIPVFISVSIAVLLYASKRANTPAPEAQEFDTIGKKVELATLLRDRNTLRNSFKRENALLGRVTGEDPGPSPTTPPPSPNESQDPSMRLDRTPSVFTLSSAFFSARFSPPASSNRASAEKRFELRPNQLG